ncbi:MAG TPA: hypothetical protein VIJ57_10305 [Hanamia sp.]
MKLFVHCFLFFCLDVKDTIPKLSGQGKPDRSARFSLPARGKSQMVGMPLDVVESLQNLSGIGTADFPLPHRLKILNDNPDFSH